ncbi:MAG: acyl-CoA dehydrogenase family protein [Candidatus Nanopelagicales bacterium]
MAYLDAFATDDKRALAQLTTDFTQAEIWPHLTEWEQQGRLPRDLHRKAAEIGLLGVGIDEELGGSGGDYTDVVVMTEAMIEAGASGGVIAALFTHGIALPHVIDEYQRRCEAGDVSGADYLLDAVIKPVLSGAMVLALGVTEPDGGSDVANLRTRASRTEAGWQVSGAKTYITSGVRADLVVAAVRTGETGDGAAGLTLMLLDPTSDGYAPPRELAKMGWWCSDTAELAFDGVSVSERDVLGLGRGFESLARHFVAERLSLAVTAYATAQRCLTLTETWTTQRETFGRALSTRQVVRHTLVEMYRHIDVARVYTRTMAVRHVNGEHLVVEAAIAKQTAVAAAEFVANQAVQLHGGMGFMRESEVERHYRDVRVLGIGGGATQVMTDLVARLRGY